MGRGPRKERHPGHPLAHRLDEIIRESGRSRYELAQISGVSYDTIGTWLTGARRLHQFILVDRILSVLGYRLTIERNPE